jgi:Mg-chelatase subunit ChlD
MKLDARCSGIVALAALAGCHNPGVTPVNGGGPGGAGGASEKGGDAGTRPPDFVVGDGGFEAGAVGGPRPDEQQCASDVQKAKLQPIDLLLLLDASGSMADKAGPRDRWEMARDALAAFLKDDRSVGLGVGLQLFPVVKTCPDDGTCFLPSPGGCLVFSACVAGNASLAASVACGGPGDDPCPAGTTCQPMGRCSESGGDCVGMGQPCPSGVANDLCGARPRQCRLGPAARGSCAPADYEKPVVPMTDLPAGTVRLIGAMDTRLPIGGTPMGPAVKGALTHLTGRLATNPGRRAVLVLVSDGIPQGCIGDVAAIVTDLRMAAARTPPISTYVVGVFADADPPLGRTTMEQLAMAGGTGTAFILSANEQLTEKFLAALSQIRGAALPCELAIPKPASGQLDFGKVNVHVDSGTGGIDLVYVERADRCGMTANGWYYDVDPTQGTPARVQLCPGVCERLKADPKAAIEVRFGCKSIVIE